MFHGIWPEMQTEAWESTGNMRRITRIQDCRYAIVLNQEQPDQETSYCDRYECILRNDCLSYREAYIPAEEFTSDGGELSDATYTEAEILEMYRGVNTVDIRR